MAIADDPSSTLAELPQSQRKTTPGILPWLLLVCLLVSLFFVAYPMYVIRPFRTQGARELAVALEAAQWRGLVTAGSAIVALAAAALYWRAQANRWRRTFAAVAVVLTVVAAVGARVNVFEIMFHPVDRPTFVAASQMKLDADEKVLVVRMGDQARAYPVRSMAYHHLVNDTLAGKAIIATY